jgi:hypothetical protein
MLKALARRILAAAKILLLPGDQMPVTRHDLLRLRADWEEWQITFTGILEQLNTFHARIAKREKRIMEAREAQLQEPSGGTGQPQSDASRGLSRKASIYRRAVGSGAGQLSLLPQPGHRPPPPNPNGDEP